MSRTRVVLVGASLLAAACASGPARSLPTPVPSSTGDVAVTASPPVGTIPAPTTSPSAPREASFDGTVSTVDARTRALMERYSWREGCPVPIEDLRILRMNFWGFDGHVHRGELVVNESVASDVLGVFEDVFEQRFRIHRMRLIDEYQGSDDRSMAADNTSAFNCRLATGSSSTWSMHAYGLAIDINPVENPYVTGSTVLPPAGRAHLDRSQAATGLMRDGGAAVAAFARIGWEWGGNWSSPTDYMHFSSNGR